MYKKDVMAAAGVLDLFLCYMLFNKQQYFSLFATSLLLLLAFIGFLIFFIPSYVEANPESRLKKNLDNINISFFFLSILIIIYEFNFDLFPISQTYAAILTYLFPLIGAISLIISIYFLKSVTKNVHGLKRYSAMVFGIITITSIVYIALFTLPNVTIRGTDEAAYNYYAAYLFLHGTNPYTSSMLPALQSSGANPTIRVDGKLEVSYPYPALSFLSLLFLPIFNLGSFMNIVFVIILATVASIVILYEKTASNGVLMPVFFFFLEAALFLTSTSHYFAISVLLLLAYTYREKVLLQGIFLGLSASMIQLAWFALPFFYILAYKESGKEALYKVALSSIAVFLFINVYFIAISPSETIGNILSIGGPSKIVSGPLTLQQLVMQLYPATSWYTTTITILALLMFLILFFLYTESLGSFIALIPASILFLSWKTSPFYTLPYIPIILYTFYGGKVRATDHLKSKKPIIYITFMFLTVSGILLLVSHNTYVNQNYIVINNLTPIINVQNYSSQNAYSLSGVVINVSDNSYIQENVSFEIITRSPILDTYLLSPQLPNIPPHSKYVYQAGIQLPLINNNTKIYVIAFSPDYIATKEIDISLRRG